MTEPKLMGMEVGDGFLEAQFQVNDTVRAFIDAWVEIYLNSGAENYFEFQAMNPDVGAFVVTIQRKDGKTPAELRSEAEEKVKDLERQLAQSLADQDHILNERQQLVEVQRQGRLKRQAEMDELRAALRELVDLKDLKDSVGKNDDYHERQPAAWATARKLLGM